MAGRDSLFSDPSVRTVTGRDAVDLLRRVVEGPVLIHRGRYAVYLGRPDPAAVRAEEDQTDRLLAAARRAVVITPETTPLPGWVERHDPGAGWLAHRWFTAILGSGSAMALVAETTGSVLEEASLLTDPDAVRRFIAAVEAEVARPDPLLIAV
jgi:hypothetical protein